MLLLVVNIVWSIEDVFLFLFLFFLFGIIVVSPQQFFYLVVRQVFVALFYLYSLFCLIFFFLFLLLFGFFVNIGVVA